MNHRCRWPGCTETVAARHWGCERHFMLLPVDLRDRLTHCYHKNLYLQLQAAQADAQYWINSQADRFIEGVFQ